MLKCVVVVVLVMFQLFSVFSLYFLYTLFYGEKLKVMFEYHWVGMSELDNI